jgi:hypothetical protein
MADEEYSRRLDALWDALAEVVPAAEMQRDYEILLEHLGDWPHLEERFIEMYGGSYEGDSDPDGLGLATWDAVRRSPAVRDAIEAILDIERTF